MIIADARAFRGHGFDFHFDLGSTSNHICEVLKDFRYITASLRLNAIR